MSLGLFPCHWYPTLIEKADQSSQDYLTRNGVLELVIGLRIALTEGFLQ